MQKTNDWSPIIPLGDTLEPIIPMSSDAIPDIIFSYAQDISQRLKCPIEYPVVTALCVAATIIGARIRVRPSANSDWECVPNLWGLLIGDPASCKTPAMKMALEPLRVLQDNTQDPFAAEKHYALRKYISHKQSIIDRKIYNEINHCNSNDIINENGQWKLLLKDIRKLLKAQSGMLNTNRVMVHDITIEKMVDILRENPAGILVARDEMAGLIAHLNSLQGQNERAMYLQAHNGDEPFIQDRIGRGTVKISTLTVSMIGTIQPSRYLPLVKQAMMDVANDGFIERFQLTVYPDKCYGIPEVTKQKNSKLHDNYVKGMLRIHSREQFDAHNPTIFKLNSKAQKIFNEWDTENYEALNNDNTLETMKIFLVKMRRTVLSLSGIYRVIELCNSNVFSGDTDEVTEDNINMAINAAKVFISHMHRCCRRGLESGRTTARIILRNRKHLPEQFGVKDVYARDFERVSSLEDAEKGLIILMHCNYIRRCTEDSSKYVWRPDIVDD